MGILKSHINIICRLKKKYPKLFLNQTLTISQQAVYANEKEFLNILKKNQIEIKKISSKFDKKNKIPDWFNTKYENNINSQYLFTMLGSKSVLASDASKYENPDLIINLNKKLSRNLHNKFENIVDIGTLEHIFDTKTTLENYVKMLKKGGYLLIAVPSSNMIDHGFYCFSPTLFFDYFSLNGFDILSSYLRESSPFIYEYKSKIYEYKNLGMEIPFLSDRAVEFIILMKKKKNVKKLIVPNQSVYIKKNNWKNNKKKPIITKTQKYKLFKELIFKSLMYLPFFFQKKIFLHIRGKNIK